MSGYNMPPGCSQADHDRAFDQLGPDPDQPEVVRLDCSHYDTEDSAECIEDRIVCGDCYQRAENIRALFDAIELKTMVQAVYNLGAARMGNHDLYQALMRKLLDAQKVGRRCTRCTNHVAGDEPLCKEQESEHSDYHIMVAPGLNVDFAYEDALYLAFHLIAIQTEDVFGPVVAIPKPRDTRPYHPILNPNGAIA